MLVLFLGMFGAGNEANSLYSSSSCVPGSPTLEHDYVGKSLVSFLT